MTAIAIPSDRRLDRIPTSTITGEHLLAAPILFPDVATVSSIDLGDSVDLYLASVSRGDRRR